MPILYTRTYPLELFGLNPEMRCVFVESHEKRGGDPSTVDVRQDGDIPAFHLCEITIQQGVALVGRVRLVISSS